MKNKYLKKKILLIQILIIMKKISNKNMKRKKLSNKNIKRVSCGIMKNRKGKILLGLRPKNRPNPGYREFPGGKCENKESNEECLKREWLEELELKVKILRIVDVIYSRNYVCTFFEGYILNEDQIKMNVHQEIGFFFLGIKK